MSQHDLSIANQGFPAFRSDLNDALQALGSMQSGTSAPATTFANMLWYDTTNNIVKIRNEDNDAWISLFTLDQSTDLLSAISTGTLTTSSTVTHNGGTANGVAYLNGSKVLTTGSALVFDGTNLGVGVTPSAWGTYKAMEIGAVGNGMLGWAASDFSMVSGCYYSGGWKWAATNSLGATNFEQYNGAYYWNIAAPTSHTAGNAIASFTQAMTLDANGKLNIGGTTTPSAGASQLSLSGYSGNDGGLQLNASGGAGGLIATPGGAGLRFLTYTGSVGSESYTERARINSSGNWVFPYGWLKNSPDGAVPCLAIGTSDTALMFINVSQKRIIPRTEANSASDNQIDLGDAGSRFKTLYAGTGSINTSDAREKTSVTPLTAEEINAAAQIAESVGTYQWLQAVEEKGASARRHAGLTVQRAIEILQANNLNPFSYGFICYDEWPEETNADGEVTKEAGNRYSFRPDELNLFISRGQQAIIQQLQADVAALKA